jgi:hypothetical protein
MCLVPTKEKEIDVWFNKTDFGWDIVGDYSSLQDGDWNGLIKHLVDPKGFDPNAPDPLAGYILEDSNNSYSLWRGTICCDEAADALLAIACLIEDRLKDKAFVYGAITLSYCRKATMIANQYLEKPIGLPACCDAERFFSRIKKLPIDDNEKIRGFIDLYLGDKGPGFGQILRKYFSEEALYSFWRHVFKESEDYNNSIGYELRNYEKWQFDLSKLEKLLNLEKPDVKREYDSYLEDYYERKDPIKASLREKEFQITLVETLQNIKAGPHYKYELRNWEELIFYKKYESIDPYILKKIKKEFRKYLSFNHSLLFEGYMALSADRKCKYLADNMGYDLLLRDVDWERIFTDIEWNPESFRRYFPMTRTGTTGFESRSIIRAIVLNDDFFEMLLEELDNAKELDK